MRMGTGYVAAYVTGVIGPTFARHLDVGAAR
ncbi:hypothetical protein BJ988_000293 [Nocardioides panzhihuensis]|uniref:Uncharacterized protein n=1 Tax=Nocardioides panzhihuensis TaxID=860243 RepID=A0A7Z0DHV7_9ACTN|nr:hypothetical protein [Nocardioides panzhihuensis]